MTGVQGFGRQMGRWAGGLLLTCVIACAAVLLPAAAASAAGEWVQVSCANPNGSSAPSEGWTASTVNPGGAVPIATAQCDGSHPMKAVLSALAPAVAGTSATLTYTPPAGSKLVGGTVDADLWAGGYSSGSYDALAGAQLDEPTLGTNPFVWCNAINFSNSCATNETYSGQAQLPSDAGGDLYAYATCDHEPNQPQASCNTRSGGDGAWSDVEIHWAHLLLSSVQSPQGTDFSGSALNRRVTGTAHLIFNAAETAGPGIYDVTVQIDGLARWYSLPNTTDPPCNQVGRDPANGQPMYDNAQPCPLSETVDASVPTAGLPDGRHELAVLVFDAANNEATVFDQNIYTVNPQHAPVPRGRRAVRGRFVIDWTWGERSTTLDRISVGRLPRGAALSVRCSGRGCPRLKLRSAAGSRIGRLLAGLAHRRFRSGDVLRLTATAPKHTSERVRLTIRSGQIPSARLGR